jgi:4-amino-4-deoxy-L-arabinose transferase-like glycosyltransferase
MVIEQIVKVFEMTRIRKLAGAVMLVMALLSYGMIFQGSRGIWERDEGRYTNIAVRMLQTGNFIVPMFNDDVPHFSKPPLTYWAIAGGITLLGWNEWGVRLPNVLAFAGTVLLVFAIARRIMPGRPWLPPVIYTTSLFPFMAANFVTTDTLLSLWETLAMLGFVHWWQGKNRSQEAAYLTMMWAGFGLAFLTKGPPGLLPLPAIVLFVLLAEGWRSVLRLFSFTGLVTFAAIGFGWYLVVAAAHPGLLTYFLRDEVALRFASSVYHRNPEWYKGFIIYVPVLLLGTLPWTFPLVRAARSIPSTLFSRSWWRDKLEGDPWLIFLILWVILPLAVFFMSKSRLPLYILPLFVPIALMAGRRILWPSRRKTSICLLAAWMVVLIALKFAGSLFPYAKDSRAMAQSIASYVQPAPSEILFIDSDPFWGLNLYLRCEVERVVSSSHAQSPVDETFLEELKENEPRVLFVVEKSREAVVIETCHSLGYPVRKLGHRGSWVFIALPEAFGGLRDLPAGESDKREAVRQP